VAAGLQGAEGVTGGRAAAAAPAAGKRVGVLAVQGAFAEHIERLAALGARPFEIRQAADAARSMDALVLPGGESTTQAKLINDLGILPALRALIEAGVPTLGTCAGLILLAQQVDTASQAKFGPGRARLATFPMTAARNAFGRQLGSFRAVAPLDISAGQWHISAAASPDAEGVTSAARGASDTFANAENAGRGVREIPMTFIRAPYISELGAGAVALASVRGRVVAAAFKNQIACAFHPELDADNTIYNLLLS
jgi:5'-phosphate synthase pdxT subunit